MQKGRKVFVTQGDSGFVVIDLTSRKKIIEILQDKDDECGILSDYDITIPENILIAPENEWEDFINNVPETRGFLEIIKIQ